MFHALSFLDEISFYAQPPFNWGKVLIGLCINK
jgi:hypothetical protein